MKKLFKEFKDFISKGSVLDLAVGMIIGAAFTAIITALVTNILQPLINMIPVSETGLQTVLRKAVLDDAGNVLTEAVILNWGAVISAVITFLLTALVLFAIIKAINTAKKGAEKIKEAVNGEEETAEAVPAEEVAAEVAEEEVKPTSDELLAKIYEELVKLNAQKEDK